MLVAVEGREVVRVREELQRLMVNDDAFLARLKHLYAGDALDEVEKHLKLIRGGGGKQPLKKLHLNEADEGEAEVGVGIGLAAVEPQDEETDLVAEEILKFKQPYLDRMYDLSAFVGRDQAADQPVVQRSQRAPGTVVGRSVQGCAGARGSGSAGDGAAMRKPWRRKGDLAMECIKCWERWEH